MQSKNNTKPDETHRYHKALTYPELHEIQATIRKQTLTTELPSTPKASWECPFFWHHNQHFSRISNLSRVLYAIPTSPFLTISPVQIMRLFITQFSPVSCHPPHVLHSPVESFGLPSSCDDAMLNGDHHTGSSGDCDYADRVCLRGCDAI